jgi:hypothetical protein
VRDQHCRGFFPLQDVAHFNAQSLNKEEEGKPLTSLKGQPKVTLVQE